MLKVFNTLSGQKETFQPLVPNHVSMYACGVTVYDLSHLGHARSALIFDVIRSYLQFRGYDVRYVRNFTDVDDKIINRAAQEGKSPDEIARTYLEAYEEDMARLGVHRADEEPKATDHIADIIKLIATLIDKGHAYDINGDVYFSVATYPAYGRLSKRKMEELVAGARVEIDERKRNPMDFALWKSSKPGEPAWDSPWGPGRPGWHIECSAMSMRHLGETFDIHGGGMDLIFPHHENEIAQSCAGTGREFARYWLHNGFVQINQEKMSKSLGNFFTIREIFEKWSYSERVTGEALRYFLLSTQYRHPLDFSDQGLLEAKGALDGFYGLFGRLEEVAASRGTGDEALSAAMKQLDHGIREAMDDDFNTPVAFAEFQTFRGEVNRLLESGLSSQASQDIRQAFKRYGQVLRLFQLSYRDWQFKQPTPPHGVEVTSLPTLSDGEIEAKIVERSEARRRKDFKRADEIRAELASYGVTLEDRPDGTTRWKR